MKRYNYIRHALRKNAILVFPLSLVYVLVMIVLYTYMYNGHPLHFYEAFPASHTVPFTLLTVLISIIMGITLVLFFEKLHELKAKHAGVGILGISFGFFAAGCPGCLFGLFPVVLSLFGITGTLALLPLNGLEFQLFAILLLLVGIYFLAEETDMSCKI